MSTSAATKQHEHKNQLKDFAGNITFSEQQSQGVSSPVVFVEIAIFPENEVEVCMELWSTIAKFMLAQPGALGGQLRRGVGGSNICLAIAEWESTDAFSKATAQETFLTEISKYPSQAIMYRHIFEKTPAKGSSNKLVLTG